MGGRLCTRKCSCPMTLLACDRTISLAQIGMGVGSMTTLFERLGGQGAIDAFVPLFYEKVLADDRTNHFFRGIDMDAQGAKLNAFLTMGFGGPNNYTGKDLREGHTHLVRGGLNDEHFDVALGFINDTLVELNVPSDLVSEVMATAEGLRSDVLNK